MKILLYILCCVLGSLPIYAQTHFTYFNKTYGGNDTINILGQAVQPIEDGYLVLGNYATTTVAYGLYIIKLNIFGSILWFKQLEETPTFQNMGISVGTQILRDGNSLILAYGKQKDILVSRLDFNGDTIWHKRYELIGWQSCQMIFKSDDSGFLIAGLEQNITSDTTRAYALKIDSVGNFEWDRRYEMGNDARFFSVQQTPWDGGYIFGGMGYSTATGYDMWVVKTFANGDTMWTKRYGSTGNDCGGFIVPLIDMQAYLNGEPITYLLTGCKNSNVPDPLYNFVDYMYISKIDEYGNIIWEKHYTDADKWLLLLTPPIIKPDKSFISSGFYLTDMYIVQSKIIHFRADGSILWQKNYTINPDQQVYIKDLQPTPDGGYVLAGYQYGLPQTAWVFKIDSLGNTCAVADCDSTVLISDSLPALPIAPLPLNLHLQPNPASGYCTVHLPAALWGKQGSELLVHDALGRLLYRISLPNNTQTHQFSVADWPSGLYFCSIDGGAYAAKLVVAK